MVRADVLLLAHILSGAHVGHRELCELVEDIVRHGIRSEELGDVPTWRQANAFLGLEMQTHQAILKDQSTWNASTMNGCVRLIQGMLAPATIAEKKMAFKSCFHPYR